tara:strand:+ start:18 stop:494 length:477 start_codon:yes stop_codon:yes gene_type:complete
MKIGAENTMVGNEAMASVLLLYYQIVSGGGISNDETVYLDPNKFNGFSFLQVEVEESYYPDIDEALIRQGAVIYLLCDLNDMISEYDDSYLSQDITKKIIATEKEGKLSSIPEAEVLIDLVSVPEQTLDYEAYSEQRDLIYKKYVLGTFIRVAQEFKP